MFTQYIKLPRAIHILCLGAFINRAGAFLVPFLTIYLQKELNLDVGFATRAIGVYGFGAVVASLCGGHLADAIGRRTVMLMSLLCGAAVLIVFGYFTSPWAIMGALLAFAVLAEMYRPAASAMIADLVEPETRPAAFGLMYVAINLGFSVAAFVGGMVATYSFQWLFWGDALTATVFAAIILFTLSETLPPRGKTRAAPAGVDAAGPPQGHEWDEVSIRDAIKHILTDWTFLTYWLASFLLTVMYMQSFSTFPLYLQTLGIREDVYGRIIALNGIMIVVLQLPVTSIITRLPRGPMVSLSAVVTAIGFGLMAPAVAVWHFVATTAIWTLGEIMNAPLMYSIVSDLAPVRLRARYMGAFGVCFSGAMMIGAPVGGAVMSSFGGKWLWGGSALIGLLAAAVYWGMRRHITAPLKKS